MVGHYCYGWLKGNTEIIDFELALFKSLDCWYLEFAWLFQGFTYLLYFSEKLLFMRRRLSENEIFLVLYVMWVSAALPLITDSLEEKLTVLSRCTIKSGFLIPKIGRISKAFWFWFFFFFNGLKLLRSGVLKYASSSVAAGTGFFPLKTNTLFLFSFNLNSFHLRLLH